MELKDMKWPCMVCGNIRSDDKISVHTVDIGKKRGFTSGTMMLNVKYCNDSVECKEGAKVHPMLDI